MERRTDPPDRLSSEIAADSMSDLFRGSIEKPSESGEINSQTESEYSLHIMKLRANISILEMTLQLLGTR